MDYSSGELFICRMLSLLRSSPSRGGSYCAPLSPYTELACDYLDELPWIDTPKSNFLTAFSFWWNSWASSCKGLKVIICGSATSWMLEKVIGDKGSLYGRPSRSIYLSPFNLYETEQFLNKKKGIVWNRYQILEAYMILGGIPYYLDMLEKTLPFNKNIDNLFFGNDAPLRREYDFLFRSLFKSSGIYRQVVETVAKKKQRVDFARNKGRVGSRRRRLIDKSFDKSV